MPTPKGVGARTIAHDDVFPTIALVAKPSPALARHPQPSYTRPGAGQAKEVLSAQ